MSSYPSTPLIPGSTTRKIEDIIQGNLTKLINSQISAKDKTGLDYDSQMNESELNNIHMNESEVVHSVFNSRESDVDDSPINNRFKIGKGFHGASTPYYGKLHAPNLRPDLSFAGLDESVFQSAMRKTTTSVPKTETSISKTSKDSLERPKTVRHSAPIIEDWDTDSDNDSVFRPKPDQKKPKFTKFNFVKSDENVKSVNKENTHRQEEYPRKSQSPRDNRRNWNGMMTQKLGNSFEFIKKACFVCGINAAKERSPRAAASISTARPVNTAAPKSKVNDALPKTYSYFKAHSPVRRDFNKKSAAKTNNLNEEVKTARVNNVTTVGSKAVVSAAVGNGENAVKSSSCWIWRPTGNVIYHTSKDSGSYMFKAFDYGNPQYTLQDQGIFDSGCSRHMTGNKSFLTYYQEVDDGFELKFNLFSVSQMCDKKNNVLFTETECLVLTPDFKLLNESQVLLKVPRQNNLYSFDLKNVVPLGGETLLEDETSGILKTFITGIENQINHKVKIIRCDNGTEFKNNDMNQFCRMKRIKREFSVARTTQQNRVAERKNRTLIEAAKTMLADSLLPTTFWAEAVSTACYV
ncbi:ribonuclease H-like domain-containing protein [Tanacetum coccineum]